MPNPKVDALEIDIVSDSSKAVSAIGKLTGCLYALGDAAKPVASRLNSIASALKRIATAEYEQINGKIESTVKKYKELGEEAKKTSKKVEKAGEEMKDAFSFEGTQKELDGVAKALSKAGLKDLANYYKGLSEKAGLADLEKEREAIDAIADAYAEKGQLELADQIRAAARDPEKLNALLARQAQLEKELAKAEKEEAKEAEKAAKEAEKQAKQQEKLAAANEKAKATAHKAAGAFAKLLKSLGRIAFYRAIRTALKNVTSAIKEGVTNLYNYSQEFGTAFAPAVDNLRQHLLLLKNAFATALRPVIEAAIPLIIQLVDWLSKLADKLAQILSVALGKTDENGRYTKAVLGDLEQSNKEAKELRRTLLGFDEINRLDGDTGRGTATSSGANFVQADVEEGNAKIGEWLKNINWDKVWDVLKLAGIVFAAFKGMKLVSTLSGAWKFLSPIVKAIGSVVSAHPVIAAIVALVTALAIWGEDIAEYVEKYAEQFHDFAKKAKQDVGTFFDNLKSRVNTGSIEADAALKSYLDSGKQIATSFIDIFENLWTIIHKTISRISDAVYKLFHGDVKGFIKDILLWIIDVLEAGINILVDIANMVLGVVNGLLNSIISGVVWLWNNGIQPVLNVSLKWLYNNVYVPIHNICVDIKVGILKGIKDLWNSIAEKINEALSGSIEKINKFIRWINDTFGAQIPEIPLEVIPLITDEKIAALEATKLEPLKEDVDLIPKIKEVPTVNLKVDKVDMSPLRNALEEWLSDAKYKVQTVAASISQNLNTPNKSLGRYASGGFPSAGSLFVAGESGAGPEWVGDLNGRTAVLNSEQMAAAIYTAMNAALANNPQGGGDIYLDGEVIYRNTVRRNNNAVRATGRSALLT